MVVTSNDNFGEYVDYHIYKYRNTSHYTTVIAYRSGIACRAAVIIRNAIDLFG